MKALVERALVCLMLCASVKAQSPSPAAAQRHLTPVGKLLHADGTLARTKISYSSADVKGWRMLMDQNRNPRFGRSGQSSPTVPEDSLWDDRFSNFSLAGEVEVLAVGGSDLYAGGRDTVSGRGIFVRWDGAQWQRIGGIIDGGVSALAVSGTDVYVGGAFTTAGGVTVNHIARWDGVSWHPLGSGTSLTVDALAVNGPNVYAGGMFTFAGGQTTNRIAWWDGYTWHPLGSGMDGSVHALAVSGADVYAGGAFTTAGGDTVNLVARWDGATWHALGAGLGSGIAFPLVSSLAVSGTDVYVGGSFATVGEDTVNSIARWDGTSWHALGKGVGGDDYTYVASLVMSDHNLYAGGYFVTAGGGTVNNIARWDGNAWHALENGLRYDVSALAVSGTEVYVAEHFISLTYVSLVSSWDGSTWNNLRGCGLGGGAVALAVKGTDVFAGGGFTDVGGRIANYIARWDGRNWHPLGKGMDGFVYALAVSGADVYAGGAFSTAGGDTVNHIARWDGTTWHALGSGTNGNVYALAVNGTQVYAGGEFTMAGGSSANYIAMWDGASWHTLGSGMNNLVGALAVSGTDLYAGGQFATAGGVSANLIARWDGVGWHALGSGIGGVGLGYPYIITLAVGGTDLYAGGQFTTAGGGSANSIARWDGATWHALGSGIGGGDMYNNFVFCLAASGKDVYACGQFVIAGDVSANRIAHWTGTGWHPLGSGMDANASSVAVSSDGSLVKDVYVGGGFTTAGGKLSNCFAHWSNPSSTSVDIFAEDLPRETVLEQNYPNPFNPMTKIQFSIVTRQLTTVKVFDVLGREAATLVNEVKEPGTYTAQWEAKGIASGVYLYRLQSGEFVQTKKMLLIK